MQEQWMRAIIEMAIEKGLRDIAENPKRGLRNLVDLGDYFANGPFQKDFFTLLQHTLQNEQSAYYALIADIAARVDPRIIKTLGMNTGYQSWTQGAQTIRALEKQNGYNIPWLIAVDLQTAGVCRAPMELWRRLITQGREMGIFSYLFFDARRFPDLLALAAEFPDCAFLCLTIPEEITEETAKTIRVCGNILPSLADTPALQPAAERLQGQHCLFAVHALYDQACWREKISTDWMQRAMQAKASFAFYIRDADCTDAISAQIDAEVARLRIEQQHPIFFINLYAEIAHIDRNISVEDCFMMVRADGSFLCRGQRYDLATRALSAVLAEAMPKVGYC